jgi:hypothetical protein
MYRGRCLRWGFREDLSGDFDDGIEGDCMCMVLVYVSMEYVVDEQTLLPSNACLK